MAEFFGRLDKLDCSPGRNQLSHPLGEAPGDIQDKQTGHTLED